MSGKDGKPNKKDIFKSSVERAHFCLVKKKPVSKLNPDGTCPYCGRKAKKSQD